MEQSAIEKELNVNVGAYIRVTRELNNTSIDAFAAMTNTDVEYIMALENGEISTISVDVLTVLNRNFGVNLNVMMEICGRNYIKNTDRKQYTDEELYYGLLEFSPLAMEFDRQFNIYEKEHDIEIPIEIRAEVMKSMLSRDNNANN